MTDERINTMKAKAEAWHDDNPFKRSLLSRLGGPHAPSTVATDRSIQAEEAAVALMRHLPESVTEASTEL